MSAVGIAAFVVFFVLTLGRSYIASRNTGPTVSEGAGPSAQLPGSVTIEPPAPIEGPSVSSGPPGGSISASGAGETKTIECNDSVVDIGGVSNTVLITGHCTSVAVSGVENVVTIDTADTITASGLDNAVTYRSGSPDVQTSGSSTVEQG